MPESDTNLRVTLTERKNRSFILETLGSQPIIFNGGEVIELLYRLAQWAWERNTDRVTLTLTFLQSEPALQNPDNNPPQSEKVIPLPSEKPTTDDDDTITLTSEVDTLHLGDVGVETGYERIRIKMRRLVDNRTALARPQFDFTRDQPLMYVLVLFKRFAELLKVDIVWITLSVQELLRDLDLEEEKYFTAREELTLPRGLEGMETSEGQKFIIPKPLDFDFVAERVFVHTGKRETILRRFKNWQRLIASGFTPYLLATEVRLCQVKIPGNLKTQYGLVLPELSESGWQVIDGGDPVAEDPSQLPPLFARANHEHLQSFIQHLNLEPQSILEILINLEHPRLRAAFLWLYHHTGGERWKNIPTVDPFLEMQTYLLLQQLAEKGVQIDRDAVLIGIRETGDPHWPFQRRIFLGDTGLNMNFYAEPLNHRTQVKVTSQIWNLIDYQYGATK